MTQYRGFQYTVKNQGTEADPFWVAPITNSTGHAVTQRYDLSMARVIEKARETIDGVIQLLQESVT